MTGSRCVASFLLLVSHGNYQVSRHSLDPIEMNGSAQPLQIATEGFSPHFRTAPSILPAIKWLSRLKIASLEAGLDATQR
jgi:hypothetical protein